jgi:hypothetical protein
MNCVMGKTMSLAAIWAILAAAGNLRAASYVVDQSAPGAADTNPGTENKPWTTVQHAADTAKAGDTVCVMEGNYPERVTLKNSGAEGTPVVFRSCPRRGAELYGLGTGKADWVRIEGFRFRAPKPEKMVVGVHVSSNNVEVIDNYFQGLYGAIFLAFSTSPGKGREPTAPAGAHIAYNDIYQCQECVWLYGCKCVFENNAIRRVTHLGISGDADYMRPFGVDHVIRYNTMEGAKPDEIGPAHLDNLQYFDTNGEYGRRFDVSYNVLRDMGELFMGEMKHSADLAGEWNFHHNIAARSWAWGICNVGIPKVYSVNNTFYDIKWNGVGVRESNAYGHDNKAEGCVIRNNIFQKIGQAMSITTGATPQQGHNIIFQCGTNGVGAQDALLEDPKMADPGKGNYRLTKASPAIGAGEGNVVVGALEYPNVYYVDPRHPAATDEGFGYAGQPYKTLAKALEVAQEGETIIVRGGVIREALKAKNDGVTVRAFKGEKVTVCASDEIAGWKRQADGWSAPLAAEPKLVLRDGQPWTEFSYDQAGKKIGIKAGGDPRLHLVETVVRSQGTNLGNASVKVEDITGSETGAPAITTK